MSEAGRKKPDTGCAATKPSKWICSLSSASRLEPQDIPLQIVYEDDDLAVIEKPAGLVVHPGAGTDCDDAGPRLAVSLSKPVRRRRGRQAGHCSSDRQMDVRASDCREERLDSCAAEPGVSGSSVSKRPTLRLFTGGCASRPAKLR